MNTPVTFKDNYDDSIEVSGADQEGNICLDATDGPNRTELVFDLKTARELAVEIFNRAHDSSDSGPVLASTISFNEGVIRLAAIHGKTVEFRYVKSDKAAPETRRFIPESYLAKNGGSFLGPDPDRDGEPRRYRLDRIKGTVGVIA